ncbi:hypothetical protein [Halorussus sp. AFM4]|uniref:hypothetical protein n=1 Tax=Halorussus sp. AFM4 TaxID=3421651 RepID=UPI003EBBE572
MTADGTPESEPDDAASDARPNEDDAGVESLVAVLATALRVLARFLAVGGSLALAGLRVGVACARDDANQRRARRWLLLEGDRWTVVAAMVLGIFVGSLALGLTNVIGVRESSFVTTMFSTIIAGLFSFIPLVIAVNQLTVSRLFGTPDRLRERIDGVHEFRLDVEALATDVDVGPTDPAAFLRLVARETGDRAVALQSVAGEAGDDEARARLSEFAASVAARADRITDRVGTSDLPVFAVLLPVMNDDYSRQFNRTRRLRARFGGALPDPADDLLAELQSALVSLDVTRQYFKTIYLRQELARLSRLLAYSGTAAFLTSTLVVMIYASGYPPAISETALLLLVTVSLAVAFSPLAILFAFVVRVATVVKRTSAPGAFTPPGERPSHAR